MDTTSDTQRPPMTALGAALDRARIESGLSQAGAMKRAGLAASTWPALVHGAVKRRGQWHAVDSTAETIARAAKAVGLDVDKAVTLAGYKLADVPKVIPMNLATVSTSELLAELQRRTAG